MANSLIIVRVTIIYWCLVEHSVFGKYETNHSHSVYESRDASSGHQFMESPRYSSGQSQHRFNPAFGTSNSKPRPSVLGIRSGTIKMKMLQDSSGKAPSAELLSYEDKPYTNTPVMIMYRPQSQHLIPQEEQIFDHFSNIEPKEAALKGFGLGLAIGLGALGGLAGLLKAILIPLLFLSAVLPFLLLLTAPIPVITMGKMFGVTKNRNDKGQGTILQDTINEVVKKLPDLSPTNS